MGTKATPQTALDERLIEDDTLEKALEDREQAKGAAGEARAKFTTMDDLVKGKVEELGLDEEETVRCGRFRISKSMVAGKSVSFETDPSARVTVTPDKEE